MELVWVALITALAAVVPQVLTWRQNRERDRWERERTTAEIEMETRRRQEDVDREQRRAAEEVAAANAAEARRAIIKFVDVAAAFLSAVGRHSQTNGQTHTETVSAISAVGAVRTGATEAVVVLCFADRAAVAWPIEEMLRKFDELEVPTWRNLNDYAVACSEALAHLRSDFIDI